MNNTMYWNLHDQICKILTEKDEARLWIKYSTMYRYSKMVKFLEEIK